MKPDFVMFSDPRQIPFPAHDRDSLKVVAHLRHLPSQQEGPNEKRTITPEGERLGLALRPAYQTLRSVIQAELGDEPMDLHSPLPRALVTLYLVTCAQWVAPDPRLNLIISMKKIGGSREWFDAQKAAGHKLPDLVRMVYDNPSLMGEQPFDKAMDEMNNFLLYGGSGRFTFGAGHEPTPSFWLLRQQIEGAPGKPMLKEGQSYLVFTEGTGKLLRVAHFAPEPTL